MENRIVIKLDASKGLLKFAVVLFVTVGYVFWILSIEDMSIPMKGIALAISIPYCLLLIRYFEIAFKGKAYIFDREQNKIYEDEKVIADFVDIDCISLEKDRDENETQDRYHLEVRFKNKASIPLKTGYEIHIYELAQGLSKITNKELYISDRHLY